MGVPAEALQDRARRRVPLGRALSKLGLASRSEARALIADGRVTVDGRVVRNAQVEVDLGRALIAVDGRAATAEGPLVVALHKPRGTVTTRRDPDGRPTVLDLVADVPARVMPAGRLDMATSGLLLCTNDTRFADWVTDPRSTVPKTYLATVRGRVTEPEVDRLRAGVTSRDEPLMPASVTLRKASSRESHLVITLTEGKNREVRRLCDAIGHPVTRLRRVQIGGLELGGLAPGRWRVVEPAELARAFPDFRPSSTPRSRGSRPAS